MIEDSLFQLISADPGFQGVAGTRIYPAILPDSPEYPAASFQRISNRRSYDLDGGYIETTRVQFDCWGSNPDQAADVAAALDALLDGYTGAVGAHFIRLVTQDDCHTGYDSNQRAFYVQQDWMLTYQPA